MPITLLCYLLCHTPALVLLWQSTWTMILAMFVSGVTFAEWNWMQVRLRLWLSPGHAPCICSHTTNYWWNCVEGVWWPCYICSIVTQSPRWLLRSIFTHIPEQLLKRLDILKKSCWVFQDRLPLWGCFRDFVLYIFEYCSAAMVVGCRYTPSPTGLCSQWCQFLTRVCVWVWYCIALISGSVMYAV